MACQHGRNLLKNPSGEENFCHWKKDQEGGDLWAVECLSGECGGNFPDPSVKKYFVTSFGLCLKSQTIDLLKEGYSAEQLDKNLQLVVEDWYAARTDSGCKYQLCVQLQGANHEVLTEFQTVEPITIQTMGDGSWKKMSYTFSGYGPGVRYVLFQHGGQDSQNWKGWYGVRVTNSSVKVYV